MTFLPALLILLSVYGSNCRSLEDDDYTTDSFQWPEEYYLKGEEINLKTGLKAPFQMWSSENASRCRRDYYGGVEKKYYDFAEMNTTYYIFPMTDEENINEYICLSLPMDWDEYRFLPDLSSANYTGTITFEDKEVDVWEHEKIEDSFKLRLKAYTYKFDDYNVPVQITRIAYHVEKAYVESHTVTNYYDFSSEIDETNLDVTWEGADCELLEAFWKKHPSYQNLDPGKISHVDLAFNRFMRQHKKEYQRQEHEIRKAIFHKNWKEVVEHNNKNLGYKLKVNKFADWTEDELKVLAATTWTNSDNSGALPFPYTDSELVEMVQDLPEEFDLHLEGMLTPVKNQEQCGSCWAFSSVAAVEGALAVRNGGRTLDLSEQSLVDCAWGFENIGCYGGTVDGGLKYILEHGLPTDQEYGPYIGKNGLCGVYNMTHLYKITGFGQVVPRNPNAMKLVLNKYGPVVVGIHASDKMKLYDSGVFYDVTCVDESANHAVAVVGYGVRDGDLFWLVKNSWGEDWGQDGYILLSANNNNCLLLDTAFYPIV